MNVMQFYEIDCLSVKDYQIFTNNFQFQLHSICKSFKSFDNVILDCESELRNLWKMYFYNVKQYSNPPTLFKKVTFSLIP